MTNITHFLKGLAIEPKTVSQASQEGELEVVTGKLLFHDGTGVQTVILSNFTGDLNLTGILTVTGQINVDNLRLDGNSLISTNTNGNVIIDPNGTGSIQLTLATGGLLELGSANATVNEAGLVTVTGQVNVDNLRLDGNTLSSTDTNGNIILDPNGTGVVNLLSDTSVLGRLTLSSANLLTLADLDNSNSVSLKASDVTATDYTITLPDSPPAMGTALTYDGTNYVWAPTSSATGDVVGPASSNDGALAQFDGVTGKLIKESSIETGYLIPTSIVPVAEGDNIYLATKYNSAGASGQIFVQTGNPVNPGDSSGDITIGTGTADSAPSGDIALITGGAIGVGGDTGGITIASSNTSNVSGSIQLSTGTSGAAAGGGAVLVSTGNIVENSQTANRVNISTGSAGTLSGRINLTTGNGTDGSGDINLNTGTGSDPTVQGRVVLNSRSVRLPVQTSDPAGSEEGDAYYNSTDDTIYTFDGAVWNASGGGGFTNPMTSVGDLIYGGTAGAPQRLPVGTQGGILTVTDNLGTIDWVAPVVGQNRIVTWQHSTLPDTGLPLFSLDFTGQDPAIIFDSGDSFTVLSNFTNSGSGFDGYNNTPNAAPGANNSYTYNVNGSEIGPTPRISLPPLVNALAVYLNGQSPLNTYFTVSAVGNVMSFTPIASTGMSLIDTLRVVISCQGPQVSPTVTSVIDTSGLTDQILFSTVPGASADLAVLFQPVVNGTNTFFSAQNYFYGQNLLGSLTAGALSRSYASVSTSASALTDSFNGPVAAVLTFLEGTVATFGTATTITDVSQLEFSDPLFFQSIANAITITNTPSPGSNQPNWGTYNNVQNGIDGSDPSFVNPMTSVGDLIIGGTAGAPDRLGVGSNGDVLTVVSGEPTWVASSSSTPVTLSAGLASAAAVGGASTIIYDTIIEDSASAYNTGTGEYIVPEDGVYQISNVKFSDSAAAVYIVVNNIAQSYTSSGGNGALTGGSIQLSLLTGDILKVVSESPTNYVGSAAPNFINTFSLFKITGSGGGGGGSGDVVGPSSASDSAFALFDGTTGKLLKDSEFIKQDIIFQSPPSEPTITTADAGAAKNLCIKSGDSSTNATAGAKVRIRTGLGNNAPSGELDIRTGNMTSASSGSINASTGSGDAATGGITLGTGAPQNATSGNSGAIQLISGDANTPTTGTSGNISITSGDATSVTGTITLATGLAASGGTSGEINLTTGVGSASGGGSGGIALITNSADGGSGSIVLNTGESNKPSGFGSYSGSISLATGNITNASAPRSGSVSITTGSATAPASTADSGDVSVVTGPATQNRGRLVVDARSIKFPTNASDPTGTDAGDAYFNTSTNKLRIYNGSTWDDV